MLHSPLHERFQSARVARSTSEESWRRWWWRRKWRRRCAHALRRAGSRLENRRGDFALYSLSDTGRGPEPQAFRERPRKIQQGGGMNFMLVRLVLWFVTLAIFPIPLPLLAQSFQVEVLQRITLAALSPGACVGNEPGVGPSTGFLTGLCMATRRRTSPPPTRFCIAIRTRCGRTSSLSAKQNLDRSTRRFVAPVRRPASPFSL